MPTRTDLILFHAYDQRLRETGIDRNAHDKNAATVFQTSGLVQ